MPAVPKTVHPIFFDESTKPLPIPAHTPSTGAKIFGWLPKDQDVLQHRL